MRFQRGDEKYIVEVRTLSATKSSSDDNHWEKLCKVSEGTPDTKHNSLKVR